MIQIINHVISIWNSLGGLYSLIVFCRCAFKNSFKMKRQLRKIYIYFLNTSYWSNITDTAVDVKIMSIRLDIYLYISECRKCETIYVWRKYWFHMDFSHICLQILLKDNVLSALAWPTRCFLLPYLSRISRLIWQDV